MRASMRGADCTRPSRMIASWRPMFSPVTLPNLRPALGVQREADRRLVVLVERRPRVAQIAARDRGDAFAPGSRPCPRRPASRRRARHDFHALRHLAVRPAALPCVDRPCSTIFSSSRPVERMISFARFDVGDAGQLHQDLIAALPCCAMLGSVTPSSLTRRSIVWRACTTASSRRVTWSSASS